jgi:hypothetical protein
MSLSVRYSISRCVDFLNIADNAIPTTSGEDKDIFVGENQKVTITLANGTISKCRDVVVLGELTIQSSNPENTAVKPILVARDFFIPAKFSIKNVGVCSRHFVQPKNNDEFRKNLQECLLDWLDFQRESVKKVGLKSILEPSTTITWQYLPQQ